MKKAIVLALVVILTLSLVVPAYAVSSPQGGSESGSSTAPLPPQPKPTEPKPTEPKPTEPSEPEATEPPFLIDDSSNEDVVKQEDKSELIPVEEAEEKLTEEAKQTFVTAQETLAAEKPKGMVAQYFFYYKPGAATELNKDDKKDDKKEDKKDDKKDNKKDDKKEDKKTTSTLVLNIQNIRKLVVKQFVDGKWVKLKATINRDGTATIEGVVEGPIAIFTA